MASTRPVLERASCCPTNAAITTSTPPKMPPMPPMARVSNTVAGGEAVPARAGLDHHHEHGARRDVDDGRPPERVPLTPSVGEAGEDRQPDGGAEDVDAGEDAAAAVPSGADGHQQHQPQRVHG